MNWDISNNAILLKMLERMEGASSWGNFSLNSLLLLLLIGGILFAAFYLLKRYVLPYLNSRTAIKKNQLFVFRLEVVQWTLFSLFALYEFLSSSFWITVVLLLIIALVGFNFWRNFFIGVIFRFENKFAEGDPVRFDEYTGIIEEVGSRSIQIKTDQEELVYLSYVNLEKSNLVKRQAKGRLLSSRISLPIGDHDQTKILDQVKNWILECPWALVNENIMASLDDQNVKVTIYAADQESLDKIEEFLIKKVS